MLIKCIECGNEVSSRASVCPNCGCPISEMNIENSEITNNVEINNELVCPDFPDDLSVGGALGIGKNYIASCEITKEFATKNFPHGNYGVALARNGLIINKVFKNILNIHKSQIINIEYVSKQEIIEQNKSVVGRAIVGGVLTGGIGAVVGGMSGIGKKNKIVGLNYLIINYWDIETKTSQKLIFSSEKDLNEFMNNFNKEFLNI